MTCAVEMKRGRKLDVWWPVEAKQKKVKASMRPSAKRRVEYSKTPRITLLKRASFSKPPFWGFKMLVFGVCNYIYIYQMVSNIFMFIIMWGDDPTRLMFFRWIETTI